MLLITLLANFFFSNDLIVDGYLNKISHKSGDSVTLYLNASETNCNYSLKLYDLGNAEVARYYVAVAPQEQKKRKSWEEGFGYEPSAKLIVPNLKSGIYFWEGKIPMIVRATAPEVVVLYSSNTENAYSAAGGKSLYGFNSSDSKMASKVSFLRPISLPRHSQDFFRWLYSQQVTELGYISDFDMDNYEEIKSAKVIIIPGHSEYWTLEARKNFDRFVSEGKNALILSGNTMWWQVRYESDNTQLVCYRSAADDPIKDPKLKTINWNEHLLQYPILNSIGVDFSLAGFGLMKDKGWDGFKVVNENSPLLEEVNLRKGDIIPLPSDEYDGTLVAGFSGSHSPIPDVRALGFEKMEIVGYDSSYRLGSDLMATWVVFKKSKSSGIIINTASTDWCSSRGMNNELIKKITLTMIRKLRQNENVFSPSKPVIFLN